MKKKVLKYLTGIAAVLLFVVLGSFPALALQHSPVALVAAATTAVPFSLQLKILAIAGSVYTILQVVKQVFPIAGLGSVILNVVLSGLGVAVVIKPEDLFSLPTLTALVIAGLTAAGAHGTIKSFTGSGGTPGTSSGTGPATTAMLLIACAMVFITGCSSLEHQAYNAIVGAKAFTQSISAQHPECGTRDANGHWVPSSSTAGVCVSLAKGIEAKDLLIDAAEEYCAGTDFQNGGPCDSPTDKTLKNQLASKVQAALQNYAQTEADIRSLIH